MSFNNGMIRVLVIGSTLLIAQMVPAFAEKVTLACRYHPEDTPWYMIIDTDANTVTVSYFSDPKKTYPARITDDAVTWYSKSGNDTYVNTYDRQTGTESGEVNHGSPPTPCVRVPKPW